MMRDRLLDVWERSKADTGIHVDFENVFMRTYTAGNIITHHAADGKIIGFLFFVHSHDHDTEMTFWIERMLWVDPEYRGERVGSRLLDTWMQRAKRLNIPVTLHAGASLGDPEIAKSIYEAQGFKTTYAFQKEIT